MTPDNPRQATATAEERKAYDAPATQEISQDEFIRTFTILLQQAAQQGRPAPPAVSPDVERLVASYKQTADQLATPTVNGELPAAQKWNLPTPTDIGTSPRTTRGAQAR